MLTEIKTVEQYIDFLVEMVFRFQHRAVAVRGNTTEERAASLLDGLGEAGVVEHVQ